MSRKPYAEFEVRKEKVSAFQALEPVWWSAFAGVLEVAIHRPFSNHWKTGCRSERQTA
jgi:hypothetical protein